MLLAACAAESAGDPGELLLEGKSLATQGDHGAAAVRFQEALDALGGDAAHPLFAKLQVAKVSSFALEDTDTAVQEFLSVSAEHPDALGKNELASAAAKLCEARAYPAAARIVQEADKRYPGDEDLVDLKARIDRDIGKYATGNQLAALKGMGYLDG
jgi:hypothetical protein